MISTELTLWLEAEHLPDGLHDAELHISARVTSRAEFLRRCEQIWTRWERVTSQETGKTNAD